MGKILFFILLSCCFLSLAVVQGQGSPEARIQKYVTDVNPRGVDDWQSRVGPKIVELGPAAVPALIAALSSIDAGYAGKRLDFVYMLGEIGDPRAYSALRSVFLEDVARHAEGHRWRLAISLGACLTEEKIEDYVGLAAIDATGGAWRAVREMTGQDFGQDKMAWGAFLKEEDHLQVFRERCRQRSVPFLG